MVENTRTVGPINVAVSFCVIKPVHSLIICCCLLFYDSNQLKEQERQSLSPANAARQLGLSAGAGHTNNEHKNLQGTELPCSTEGGYAILSSDIMVGKYR